MKKTILSLTLLSAALSAFASAPSATVAAVTAAAVNTAAGVAVAGPVLGPAVAATAAVVSEATKAAAVAPTATPAPVAQATVSVKGATTVAGAPLLLSVDGAKAAEPKFETLFKAGQAHPQWKVSKVKAAGVKSRMFLKSTSGNATMEMDVATTLAQGLNIAKDTVIALETETSGQGSIIKFMKGKTPIGFMVNSTTKVR